MSAADILAAFTEHADHVEDHGDAPLPDHLARAEREAQAAALHTVRWTLDTYGVNGKITCHAGPDDDCHRTTCDTCDEDCFCDDPTPGRLNFCNPIEWIEHGGYLYEYYDGPDDTPVRDGPVAFTWTGEGYEWHYADLTADLGTCALIPVDVPSDGTES
jgi:hypothetical protein